MNMGNISEPTYEVLNLNRPSAHLDDLKTILCERIIKSQGNTICYEGIEDVKPAQACIEGMLRAAYCVT